MLNSILLQDCTSANVANALESGFHTVVIPCAAPHPPSGVLPRNTGEWIANALALRVAGQLGDALVAPVVSTGVAPVTCAAPDGSAAADPALADRLAETCLPLAEQGFRNLVVLPGNLHPFTVSAVIDSVQERIFAAELPAGLIAYGDALQRRHWQQEFLARSLGGTAAPENLPGDLAETSMLLALRPDLARGKPLAATADLGAALLDYLSAEMAREIRARILCRR